MEVAQFNNKERGQFISSIKKELTSKNITLDTLA